MSRPARGQVVSFVHRHTDPSVRRGRRDNLDAYQIEGAINIPFSDALKLRLAGNRTGGGAYVRRLDTGKTGYIDQIDACQCLPGDVKQRIDGLEVVYKFGPVESSPWCSSETVRYLKVGPANRSMYERADRDWPAVSHPLVFTQPGTAARR